MLANVTSGVFPTARVGGTLQLLLEAGLKLINKTVVPSGTDAPNFIYIYMDLEDNGHYLIIGKDVKYTSRYAIPD